MKTGYHPGLDHQQFVHGMQAATVKQEPMDQCSSKPDIPVDMTMTPPREALYQPRDQHVSPSSPQLPSPNRFDQTHQRDRIQQHQMFQAQVSASLGQRMLPYNHPMYPHSAMPEDSESRHLGGTNNKRKQVASLPLPSTPPSHHHSPQPSDLDDDVSHMRMNKDEMIMNNLLSMGKEWHPSSLIDDHKLQPRASSGHQRARREFVPDDKKDTSYWCKRLKNNDSARRSRVKRKALEKMMESRLLELQKENIELRHEMAAMERRYNVKRSREDGESSDSTPTLPSSGQDEFSQMNSHDTPSPPSDDKLSREEELECASAGSDDSRSNDDSRMYSVGSVSALHRSLRLSSRDRAESMLSTSTSFASIGNASSTASVSSSNPTSRPTSCTSVEGAGMRLDKSGALDLTSDSINRSTPARDSPDDFRSRPLSGMSSDNGSLEDAAAAVRSMKNFPLKCRWKREMQSAHGSPGEERRDCQ